MKNVMTATPRHAIDICVAVLRAGISPLLIGQPGIGKSALHEAIARVLGLRMFKVDGLLIKPVSLEGLPFPCWDTRTTQWLPPAFLPDLKDTLWCIEELSSPRRDTQAMLQTVFHERRIGFHEIPDSCLIMATGNTLDSGAVAQKIPAPLLDRICVIELVPSREDWLFWAAESGIDPRIMACVRLLPESFYTFESSDYGLYASPRGWHKASNLLKSNPGDDVLAAALSGILGKSVGLQVVGLLDTLSDLPSPQYCIDAPEVAPVPARPAARYTVAVAISRLVNRYTLADGLTYCERLGATYAEVYMDDATRRDLTLKQTETYIAFVAGGDR